MAPRVEDNIYKAPFTHYYTLLHTPYSHIQDDETTDFVRVNLMLTLTKLSSPSRRSSRAARRPAKLRTRTTQIHTVTSHENRTITTFTPTGWPHDAAKRAQRHARHRTDPGRLSGDFGGRLLRSYVPAKPLKVANTPMYTWVCHFQPSIYFDPRALGVPARREAQPGLRTHPPGRPAASDRP